MFPMLFMFVVVLLNRHFQEITQRSTKEVVSFSYSIICGYSFLKTIESKDIQEVKFIVLSLLGLMYLFINFNVNNILVHCFYSL